MDRDPVIHASVLVNGRKALLRDLARADIGRIVDYWHGGGADLAFLGIEAAKLGSWRDTAARYRKALPKGNREQRHLAYAILLDGAFVGYTLLNQYTPLTNYSHWHITAPGERASGLSTALYPHRIKMYFDTTNMERLIHQTRTRNAAVNRMLDKFVPVAETVYVAQPDGVASPGEFRIRYVDRALVPRLFDRAAALARR